MDEVLWKDKRIQGITLVYRILVISLQLIKCYNVPNGEEDERCSKQQRQHVTEGRERERHGRGGAGSSAGASGEKRRRALWVKPFTSRGHSPHRRRRCRRHRRLGSRAWGAVGPRMEPPPPGAANTTAALRTGTPGMA